MLKYFALVLCVTALAAEVPDSKAAGVGIVLGVEGESIVVKRILPDSPAAAHKGIVVGDKIVAVAQDKEAPVQLQGVKLAQAVPLLRGAPGTTVRLTIVRAGEADSQARVVSMRFLVEENSGQTHLSATLHPAHSVRQPIGNPC